MAKNTYLNRQRSQYDAGQVLIASADATADEVGSGVDIGENVEIDVKSIYRGALGNADNSADVVVEESEDNITFSTLGNMDQLTATITEDDQIFRTTKRWVRASTTTLGTTKSIGGFEVYIKS